MRPLHIRCAPATLVLLMACGPRSEPPARLEGPPANLRAEAASFFDAYGNALTAGRRDTISAFYHPAGALRVLNGRVSRQSRSAIDSHYRGAWSPPAYFAWDSLAFDSIAPNQVLVTGGFRWQRKGQADTARYLYAALLEAGASGLGIRFEHETARPAR